MSIARNALLRMSKSHWRADRVMTRGFARKAIVASPKWNRAKSRRSSLLAVLVSA